MIMLSSGAMVDTLDYRAIFNNVESTLIRIGEQNGVIEIRQRLDEAKTVATRDFSDSTIIAFWFT
jgi:hypothetical protein